MLTNAQCAVRTAHCALRTLSGLGAKVKKYFKAVLLVSGEFPRSDAKTSNIDGAGGAVEGLRGRG